MLPSFTDLLNQYTQRIDYSPSQLARLCGVPRMTLVNWLKGRAQKPRVWTDVARVAQALRLHRAEADELLQAAGFPPISYLAAQVCDDTERELVSFWATETKSSDPQPPFQAIRDLPTFVGRKALLATLQEQMSAADQNALTVLEGPAGVGKTVLAARLAYRLRSTLPDGVLWVRLDRTNPMSALQLFAGAYGRHVTVFEDLESRSAAVRELLAHKQALVVLDHAQTDREIESLLPPSGNCAVLITTRCRNLAAAHGAVRCRVEPFSREEANLLFTGVLGNDFIAREHTALTKIARLLGYLPLALDVAACRLANEPNWSAADFLVRLHDEHQRLNELVLGERSVRSALEASYALLPPAQQRFFASLSVFEGRDFCAETAATASAIPVATAETYLREFFGLSLVRRGRPFRRRTPPPLSVQACHYRLIPLLQSFAGEKAANHSTV